MKVYLTVIAKNEYPYIKEFINHHINIGIDKIFLYDNNDIDGENYYSLLHDEIKKGYVEIIDVRGQKKIQLSVYKESYRKYNNDNGWMLFLDVDEFFILNEYKDIHDLLSQSYFNDYNQILFNWLTMGDSDRINYENIPLLERFTTPVNNGTEPAGCSLNRHVKCALRLNPEIDITFTTPHCAINVAPSCDPKGNHIITSCFNYEPDYSIAYVKHFHYKTIEEFLRNKMRKGFADETLCIPDHFHDFFDKNKITLEKTKWMIDYIFELQQKQTKENTTEDNIILLNKMLRKFKNMMTCLDCIYEEKPYIIQKDLNDITNYILYYVICNIHDITLYDFIKDIKNNLIYFKDNIISKINPSAYDPNQFTEFQKALIVWCKTCIDKITYNLFVYRADHINNVNVENDERLVKDFKIDVYTVCWNEIDLIKFVVDYWKRFARHVFVFDNGSNDGTIEYLKQFDWITVIPFDTDDKIDDQVYIDIKNNMWKYSRDKADYVVVCDIDECLWSTNLDKELHYMKNNNQSICHPKWYTMIGDKMYYHQDGVYLHEQMRTAYGDGGKDKAILFSTKDVEDINYYPGCHQCDPDPNNLKIYDGNNIFAMHYAKSFGPEYSVNKHHILRERLSETNKKKGYGVHYLCDDDRIINGYKKHLEQAFDINNIIYNNE
jgi:hypothetical protein